MCNWIPHLFIDHGKETGFDVPFPDYTRQVSSTDSRKTMVCVHVFYAYFNVYLYARVRERMSVLVCLRFTLFPTYKHTIHTQTLTHSRIHTHIKNTHTHYTHAHTLYTQYLSSYTEAAMYPWLITNILLALFSFGVAYEYARIYITYTYIYPHTSIHG